MLIARTFTYIYPTKIRVLDILIGSSYNRPRIQETYELLYQKTLLHHSP
jgi:hypothetical protein